MRDRTLGLKMKLLSQIQVGRAFLDIHNLWNSAQATRAQQDEEKQETRQQQGEEEALSTVFRFFPHSQFSKLLDD